jgi:RNA polymerase sigma-70 factor (ECF subfamily)
MRMGGMRGDDWKPAADAAMDRYADGDDSALRELLDLLGPRLHAFLLRRTRNPAKAEDLVQQTFLQMHCARRHFERGAQVMPWAFAIARRLLIDGLRKGDRECPRASDEDEIRKTHPEPTSDGRPSLGRALPTERNTPDCVVGRQRLLRRVDEELDRLPEAHRIAFDLVQGDGLSMAEAAQVLGITEMAVRLRAHRAYEALRERLGDDVREELGALR